MVYNYRDGRTLPGRPTKALTQASASAEPTGAVPARYERGWWFPVEPWQEQLWELRGWTVITVYVL